MREDTRNKAGNQTRRTLEEKSGGGVAKGKALTRAASLPLTSHT